jgi:aldehyde dehydrogenase (NAD+)
VTGDPRWRYRLFINGQWRDGTGAEDLDVVNPATEEIVGSVPQASTKDITDAIGAARIAFDDGPWGRLTPSDRSALMLRAAEEMTKRIPDFVELNIAEAGSVRDLAESTQTALGIKHFTHWAERAASFPYIEPLNDPSLAGDGAIFKVPVGVVAAITPFNFPLYLNLWKLGPALAMGNTVVLKPSPYTPLEAFALAEVFEAADFPPGVVNVVTGDAAAGEELTSHPAVDMVTFTGSDVVGSRIMGQASETVKRLVLELGGKAPYIVFADADVDAIAPAAAHQYIRHQGQGCGNPTRMLVEHSVHDEFVARMVDTLAGVEVGDPADPTVTMGPLIRESQRARAERYIQSGLDDGASVAFGGQRPAHLERGYFVEPTLLVDVDNSWPVAQDEIFGPVACVIPFRDADDAVRIANDSRYGLCSWVWSGSTERAMAVAQRLRIGMVNVNGGAGGLSLNGTFGGFKRSGLGRELSDHGLHEYLELKTMYWPTERG